MKVLLISELNGPARYFITKILAERPTCQVISITYDDATRTSIFSKVLKSAIATIRSACSAIGRVCMGTTNVGRWDQPRDPINHPNVLRVPWQHLRGRDGPSLIKALSPDIIVVCGAPIIPEHVFRMARRFALNVHLGIPPEYRGNNTVFWALYRKDYLRIGGCIHHVSNRLDGGDIVVTLYPAISTGDSEYSILRKLLDQAASELLALLQRAERECFYPNGVKQVKPGRNWRRADRGLKENIMYMIRRGLLRERLPTRPGNTIRHYERLREGTGAHAYAHVTGRPKEPREPRC